MHLANMFKVTLTLTLYCFFTHSRNQTESIVSFCCIENDMVHRPTRKQQVHCVLTQLISDSGLVARVLTTICALQQHSTTGCRSLLQSAVRIVPLHMFTNLPSLVPTIIFIMRWPYPLTSHWQCDKATCALQWHRSQKWTTNSNNQLGEQVHNITPCDRGSKCVWVYLGMLCQEFTCR